MKNKAVLLVVDFILLVFYVGLDQLTKYMAVLFLKNKPAIPIIENVLELHYLENKGAAFGMLQNQKIFFIFIAFIILFAIAFVLVKTPFDKKYTILHILLVMIAGGAVGNMIDRFVQDYVVDFIYFVLIDFPIFNVADIYVSLATVGLIIVVMFVYKEEDFDFLSVKKKYTRKPNYTKDSETE